MIRVSTEIRDLPESLATGLLRSMRKVMGFAGDWLPFDAFMDRALHAPGIGYYARGGRVLGRTAADGSDFVTAPELSPLFGRVLAAQLAQALQATGTDQIWEFGAGSGALAQVLLEALDALGVPNGPLNTVPQVMELAQVAALAMFNQPYAGSNALFHGLPLSIDGQRAGGDEKAPKIGEHNGKA